MLYISFELILPLTSKDLKKVVFCRYEEGDGPTRTFPDSDGCIGLNIIKRQGKMIRDIGSIQLLVLPGGLHFARISKTIQEVKQTSK